MNPELIFRIAFGVLWAILLIIRAASAFGVHRSGERLLPDQKAVEREGKGAFAIRLLLFFVLIGVVIAYVINPLWIQEFVLPLPGWLRWLGFAAGLSGTALLAWTQMELGRYWSAQLQLRAEHRLVTSGPYARVRHPLYTAMFMFGIGLALVSAHWFFVLFAAITIPGLLYRAPREEQMMIDQFGDEYRNYMNRTGRFLPLLRKRK